jgi:hypothetical protein
MRTFTHLIICLTTLFLLPQFSYPQDKKKVKRDAQNMEFYNAVFDKNDPNFDAIIAPEEWKDESYVVLAINTYVNVGSKKGKLRGINRKRVLLQDQNAVELFTEFYFQDSETILITLTKKSGEEIEINTKDAIKVTTEVPSVYSSRFQSSQSYKFAIPNIEIGDILDFTSIYSQDFGNILSYVDALSDTEPILHQNITIDIYRKWDIYRNTFNTDSKFDFSMGKGHNFDGMPSLEMNRYSLITKRLEARSNALWENVYEVEPIIKFLGVAPSYDSYYLGNNRVRDSIDISAVIKKIAKNIDNNEAYFSSVTNTVLNRVKTIVTKKDLSNVKADACYYYLREYMNESYHPQKAIKSIKSESETYESIYSSFSSMDEIIFLTIFTSMLQKMGVPTEIVAAMPSRMGELSSAVTLNELYYGVYVPITDTYYWPINKNSTHFDIPYELMSGATAKSIINKSDLTKDDIAKLKYIKPILPQENKESNFMQFKLNTMDLTTTIKKQMKTTGFQKTNYKSLIEEFGENMFLDFLSMYDDLNIREELEEYTYQSKKDKKGVYEDFIQKSDKNMADAFKAWIEEKDTKTTVIAFESISSGRTSVKPELIVEVEYTTDGLLKKLGPNIIFDIGKNIGNQLFIEEKSKADRKHDILIGAARQYEFQMDIDIPEGYFIDNIDALNKSVSNEYCSFVSTATIEGNKLKVSTLKSYNKPKAPKSAWNDIVKMIDEAYKFSQEKVILKKKS